MLLGQVAPFAGSCASFVLKGSAFSVDQCTGWIACDVGNPATVRYASPVLFNVFSFWCDFQSRRGSSICAAYLCTAAQNDIGDAYDVTVRGCSAITRLARTSDVLPPAKVRQAQEHSYLGVKFCTI